MYTQESRTENDRQTFNEKASFAQAGADPKMRRTGLRGWLPNGPSDLIMEDLECVFVSFVVGAVLAASVTALMAINTVGSL